jgi:hypothetical protein
MRDLTCQHILGTPCSVAAPGSCPGRDCDTKKRTNSDTVRACLHRGTYHVQQPRAALVFSTARQRQRS